MFVPTPLSTATHARARLLDLASAANPQLVRDLQKRVQRSTEYFYFNRGGLQISHLGGEQYLGGGRDLGLCVTVAAQTQTVTVQFCVMTRLLSPAQSLQFISQEQSGPPDNEADIMDWERWARHLHPDALHVQEGGLPIRNRDRNAIHECGFLALSGVFLPNGTPDESVQLVCDLPVDQFLAYEVSETPVLPTLLEAMRAFTTSTWNPTETITMNPTMYMHILGHVTDCYVHKVLVEHTLTDPLDFIVWYFTHAQSVAVQETPAPPGQYWVSRASGGSIPLHYVTRDTGVYLRDDSE